MKRFLRMLPVLFALAALAGCSSVTVNYDYDNEVDFSRYKTYAWMAPQNGGQNTPGQAQFSGDLVDRRIRTAVEGVMKERGLIPNPGEADLLVVYHLGAQDKIQVTDWGYRYSNYYYGYGGRQIDVNEFTEGTLIIDLIDGTTTNLVWRGSGTGVIDETQRSPEEMQSRANDVVTKIMKKFPPK